MRRWNRASTQVVFDHPWLRFEKRRVQPEPAEGAAAEREALVIAAPDWVNVVPLTADDRVVFVRQWRFGVEATTLEIPGGLVDPGEEPIVAAARELAEETGYRASRFDRIGRCHPNPAILDNRVTTFLAAGLEPPADGDRRWGVGEEETETVLVPLSEVPGRIRSGEISHALVIAAFYCLDHRVP